MSTLTATRPAAPAAERNTSGLTRTIASEWQKLRSVRSTYMYLSAVVLSVAVGGFVAYLMTADYDSSTPDVQAVFGSADPGQLALPVTQFCLAALAALVMTSEYATGMIRTSLTAVPARGRMFAAKAVVAAAVAAVAGLAMSFGSYFLGAAITGDRPAPIRAWESLGDAMPSLLANSASVVAMALLGLGLGAILRATAGALVAVTAILFVLPIVAQFLPAELGMKVFASLPIQLPGQLAGIDPNAVYDPWGAGAVLAAYGVVALTAGWFLLKRRDA
ncbi:ABC transporter permease [Phytomonospora endophytica]|uniref:ABC-type transport system involved in multi-copper enzyme maturation permease subunit n=1 Tax=Phytomonospora endophytica TaxID=714109 RepID=A0A841FUU3_9ACTN|nr:ABC transporter permease [Phytomonospora endophytica]MBB6037117.1 ABC-type transport system involved in multi-copper enzyme maturation permease subunit [Phytomonospora endophytica]GIG71156.1 ABC transporter [Phytomonospora endophytica]